jgi:hypothetical protein
MQQDYAARDIRFDERFVEIYTETAEGKLTVDYDRLHDTEPVIVWLARIICARRQSCCSAK